MVLPRTHLGSSQNSKSEVICPGLETQTKSILCTLAYEPNPYGSSQNSSWVIPELKVLENLDIIQLIESNVILECLSILGIKAAVSAIFRHNQRSEHCFILN